MNPRTYNYLLLNPAKVAEIQDNNAARTAIVFTQLAPESNEPNNNDDYLKLKIFIGIGIMATMVIIAYYLRHITNIVESIHDANKTKNPTTKRPRHRTNNRARQSTETVIDQNSGIIVRTFSFNHDDNNGDHLNPREILKASSQEKLKLAEYAEKDKINRIEQAHEELTADQKSRSSTSGLINHKLSEIRNTKSMPKETKSDRKAREIRERKERKKIEKKEKEMEDLKTKKQLDSLKQTRQLQRQEEKEKKRRENEKKPQKEIRTSIVSSVSKNILKNQSASSHTVLLNFPTTSTFKSHSDDTTLDNNTTELMLNIPLQSKETNSIVADYQVQEENLVDEVQEEELVGEDNENVSLSNGDDQSQEGSISITSSDVTQISLPSTSELDTSQGSQKMSSISNAALKSLFANPGVMERIFETRIALKEIHFTANIDQSYSMNFANYIKSLAFLYIFHRYNAAYYDFCFANSSRILRTNLVHTVNNTEIKLQSLLVTQNLFRENRVIKPKETPLYRDYNYTDQTITNVTNNRKEIDPNLVFTWIKFKMIPFINLLDANSKVLNYPIETKILKAAMKLLIIAMGEYCDEKKKNYFKELLDGAPEDEFFRNSYNFIRITSFMRNKLAHDKPFDQDTPEWLQQYMQNKLDPNKTFEESIMAEWLRIAKLINHADSLSNINFATLLSPEEMPIKAPQNFKAIQELAFFAAAPQEHVNLSARRSRSVSAPIKHT